MPTFAFCGSLAHPAPGHAEASGRCITSFRFDDETGRLEPVGVYGGTDDTIWLTLDAVRRRLYAIGEASGSDQSSVESFGIDPATGALQSLGRQPTGGQTACHASLSPDRRLLFVANYNGAVPPGAPGDAVRSFPVGPDGALLAPVASLFHAGGGPNSARQERSHAHCALPSPDGRFLYVADLGLDRIVVYAIAPDGGLVAMPERDFVAPPGIGPRHLVFRRDGRMLFMVSELIATVIALRVDPATGALTEVAAFPVASRDGGIVQPAGLVLTADERFLFVELRGCNEILGLGIEAATGALAPAGRWPSGGLTPRDLAISPSGRHLLVTNQDSDTLAVFGIDQTAGTLSPLAPQPIERPMAIGFARL